MQRVSLDKMIVDTFKFVKFNVNHTMDLEMETSLSLSLSLSLFSFFLFSVECQLTYKYSKRLKACVVYPRIRHFLIYTTVSFFKKHYLLFLCLCVKNTQYSKKKKKKKVLKEAMRSRFYQSIVRGYELKLDPSNYLFIIFFYKMKYIHNTQ